MAARSQEPAIFRFWHLAGKGAMGRGRPWERQLCSLPRVGRDESPDWQVGTYPERHSGEWRFQGALPRLLRPCLNHRESESLSPAPGEKMGSVGDPQTRVPKTGRGAPG